MALAYLFSEINQTRHSSDFEIPILEPVALIVDHRARESSKAEADKVSCWLRDLSTCLLSLRV